MAIANALAFLLYLGSSVILIRRFVKKQPATTTIQLPLGIMVILAILFHTVDIVFTMRAANGWDLSLVSTLSISSWLMAVIAFVVGLTLNAEKAHPGIVIFPLVALSLILRVEGPHVAPIPLTDPALEWHVLLSLAAYSLFALAALQAIILHIQERQLRRRQLSGLVNQLPPLQSMETALFQLLTTGFVLLTLGLITGAMFIDNLFAQHLVHKTVLSLIAWLVFAALLFGRLKYGWRGNTAVKWTLIGFSCLVLAYVGSKFVLEYIVS
jgi:ABC-type uncharacterized transport system permease subunit